MINENEGKGKSRIGTGMLITGIDGTGSVEMRKMESG